MLVLQIWNERPKAAASATAFVYGFEPIGARFFFSHLGEDSGDLFLAHFRGHADGETPRTRGRSERT